MTTCETCEREAEHIIKCAECEKQICSSCAHHYKNQYLCGECLKKVYTHPVRNPEEEPKEEPEEPEKPPVKLPIFWLASLIIVIAFLVIGWTYVASLPPANTTEPEPKFPPVVITVNDTFNVYGHMRPYLEFTGYSVICDETTVTGLEISLTTHSMPLTLTSVELFGEEVLGDFSEKDLPALTTTKTTFGNLQTYAKIDQTNTTSLELIFIANRGIYQKAEITPNPTRCND